MLFFLVNRLHITIGLWVDYCMRHHWLLVQKRIFSLILYFFYFEYIRYNRFITCSRASVAISISWVHGSWWTCIRQHPVYPLGRRCKVFLMLKCLLSMWGVGSTCDNSLKHHFNYKSVRSHHLLESSVISFSVFLYLGSTECLPDPSLQPPCREQRRSDSFPLLLFFFSRAVLLNKAKSVYGSGSFSPAHPIATPILLRFVFVPISVALWQHL